jgi:hypothetical protein
MVSGPKRVDIAFDAVSAMAQSNRSKAAAARVRPLSSAGQAARSRWDQGFESGFLQQRVYELSVPERRTLNDKCRGAIVIITHRGCTRTI